MSLNGQVNTDWPDIHTTYIPSSSLHVAAFLMFIVLFVPFPFLSFPPPPPPIPPPPHHPSSSSATSSSSSHSSSCSFVVKWHLIENCATCWLSYLMTSNIHFTLVDRNAHTRAFLLFYFWKMWLKFALHFNEIPNTVTLPFRCCESAVESLSSGDSF